MESPRSGPRTPGRQNGSFSISSQTAPKVHHGASESLDAIGVTREIETAGRYDDIRSRSFSMDRESQAEEIRRLGASPDFMLGSVHAVTETGSLITASMSGSQLGPYGSGAGRVILVVGTQKIVSDLEEGLRRVEEYASPSRMLAPRRRMAFTAG